MLRRVFAAAGMLLLIGAGCTRQPAPPVTPEPQQPDGGDRVSYIVGKWDLREFTAAGGTVQDLSELGAWLELEAGGDMSAKFCNQIGGTYSLEGGRLTSLESRSTLMFCTGPIGDAEVTFVSNLEAGLAYSGGGDELTLRADDGATLEFHRGSASAGTDSGSGDESLGGDRVAAGVITNLDLEGMMVDGPAKITIRTAAGGTAAIHVPSFGRNLCKAKEIADVGTLKVGMSVEARGSVENEDGAIVPCTSAAHYFRVSAQ